MLKAWRKITDGAGELGIDGTFSTTGWGRVMGLVQNQETAGAKTIKPYTHRTGIGFVDDESLRNQKSGKVSHGLTA